MNILTRNSARTLAQALRSTECFAEVIVSDGGSTDATLDIANEFGCRVVQQDPTFLDSLGRLAEFGQARAQLFAVSREPWVLRLDSDEYFSPELVLEIKSICSNDRSLAAYELPALYELGNRRIDCASSYPMHFLRLYQASRVRQHLGSVSETGVIDGEVGRLVSPFLIPLPRVTELAKKWRHYLPINAATHRHAPPESRLRARRVARSSIRWFARNVYRSRSRRDCEGHHIPVRYELARLRFYLAAYLQTFWIRPNRGRFPGSAAQ